MKGGGGESRYLKQGWSDKKLSGPVWVYFAGRCDSLALMKSLTIAFIGQKYHIIYGTFITSEGDPYKEIGRTHHTLKGSSAPQ